MNNVSKIKKTLEALRAQAADEQLLASLAFAPNVRIRASELAKKIRDEIAKFIDRRTTDK